jgi:hypothetical protein
MGRSGIKRDTALKVPRQREIAGYLHKFSLHLWAVLSSWELCRTRQKNKIDSVYMLWIHVTSVSYIIQVIYYNYFRIALKNKVVKKTFEPKGRNNPDDMQGIPLDEGSTRMVSLSAV